MPWFFPASRKLIGQREVFILIYCGELSMSLDNSAVTDHLLRSSNRQAEARELLDQLPPTGVRGWEVALSCSMGGAISAAMYLAGETPVISALFGATLLAASLAVAASRETHKLARRLAAAEAILMRETGAA
jgi:hypothetical protein